MFMHLFNGFSVKRSLLSKGDYFLRSSVIGDDVSGACIVSMSNFYDFLVTWGVLEFIGLVVHVKLKP